MDTFLAIDIGSNAIRTVITRREPSGEFVILKKMRSSIRLGSDVFVEAKISDDKIKKMVDIFDEVKKYISEHEITKIRACATSALREAKNGKEIIQLLEKNSGIKIELISGDTEAKLIHDAVLTELHFDDQLTILVDIGGGSTEFTISEKGKLIACKSFNIGSVRLLSLKDHESQSKNIVNNLVDAKKFIESVIGKRKIEKLVGTGGNFRRIGKINRKLSGKNFVNYMTTKEVDIVYEELSKLTHNERVKKFDLSDDRADVIVPAVFFIQQISAILEVPGVYIPKVGLKEGILLSLYL